MKSSIQLLFLVSSICTAFAGELTVRSFSVKESFPSAAHLLNQPEVIREGKAVTIPYIFCGVFSEEHIKEHATLHEVNQNKDISKTILPNGATCRVTLLSKDVADGVSQLRVKIEISGPKNLTMEGEKTTFPGQGLLLRYDSGDESKSPELILLQIKISS